MNLKMKITYVVELSTEEIRLMSASLRRSLKPEQEADAITLNTKLCESRIAQAKQLAREMEKLENNIEKEGR